MTNFDKIKSLTIDKFAQYIRSKCVHFLINGVALDVESIKEWLLKEEDCKEK